MDSVSGIGGRSWRIGGRRDGRRIRARPSSVIIYSACGEDEGMEEDAEVDAGLRTIRLIRAAA